MRPEVAVVHEYIRDIDNSVLSRGTTSSLYGGIHSGVGVGKVLGIKTCREFSRSRRVRKECRDGGRGDISVPASSISAHRNILIFYAARIRDAFQAGMYMDANVDKGTANCAPSNQIVNLFSPLSLF